MIHDSMEISHIEEKTPFVEKRPSKKEMWIWKDFRNCEKYHRISERAEKMIEIQKEIKTLRDSRGVNGKEIEHYNCSLKARKDLKGVLTIMDKSLQFAAANGANIIVPYDFIEEVAVEVNIFEKELVVKTSIGSISFLHFA
jgi:hypothetical protein